MGNRAGITEWRQYFEDLRAAVSDAIAAGLSLEDMQRQITMDDYSHWGGHDWVPGVPVIETMHICGTGTRYLTEEARVAITDLFERSFRPREQA